MFFYDLVLHFCIILPSVFPVLLLRLILLLTVIVIANRYENQNYFDNNFLVSFFRLDLNKGKWQKARQVDKKVSDF